MLGSTTLIRSTGIFSKLFMKPLLRDRPSFLADLQTLPSTISAIISRCPKGNSPPRPVLEIGDHFIN